MEELERKLKIKDEYLTMIINLACDYDGYRKAESLMYLIDRISDLAKKGVTTDDKSTIWIDTDGKKFNILMEKIN